MLFRDWLVFNANVISILAVSLIIEWVIDCCLTPTQQFFSYIMREQVNFQWDDDEVRFVLDQHTFIVLAYCNNSLRIDMSFPLGNIILFPSPPLFLLNVACLGIETTNTNFIVFDLTWPGLEHTIYHTWDKHTKHYTTDAVLIIEDYAQLFTVGSIEEKLEIYFDWMFDSLYCCKSWRFSDQWRFP